VPVGHPEALPAGFVRTLAGHLNADDGLARLHDRADNAFNRIGQRRDGVAHPPPDVIRDRNAADFG